MDAAESVTNPAAAPAAHRAHHGASRQVAYGSTDTGELSEREQRILAFERQWWKYQGAKEQAIRESFGMSSTRYYQLLNKLMDKHAAMTADPMLVKRLRKMRASRQRTRTARRLGIELR